MTRDEHITRAMLLGMQFHHNNGDAPFYYKVDEGGNFIPGSAIDAVTLQGIRIETEDDWQKDLWVEERKPRRRLKGDRWNEIKWSV